VGQRGEALAQRQRIGAHLDAERTLAGAGQHLLRIEQRTDACAQPEPLEPRGGQHDRVVLALVELAQPRVEVAAQRLDAQARALGEQAAAALRSLGAVGYLDTP